MALVCMHWSVVGLLILVGIPVFFVRRYNLLQKLKAAMDKKPRDEAQDR